MLALKPSRWVLAASLCLAAGLSVAADHASSSNDEARIDARLTKDADDHLKSNLADDDKKTSLKTEILRAEAVRQMAETLAHDPKFEQAYATLLKNSDKRWKSTMPTDAEVIQEKERIINDPDATRIVMAKAILVLQSHDQPHH